VNAKRAWWLASAKSTVGTCSQVYYLVFAHAIQRRISKRPRCPGVGIIILAVGVYLFFNCVWIYYNCSVTLNARFSFSTRLFKVSISAQGSYNYYYCTCYILLKSFKRKLYAVTRFVTRSWLNITMLFINNENPTYFHAIIHNIVAIKYVVIEPTICCVRFNPYEPI